MEGYGAQLFLKRATKQSMNKVKRGKYNKNGSWPLPSMLTEKAFLNIGLFDFDHPRSKILSLFSDGEHKQVCPTLTSVSN